MGEVKAPWERDNPSYKGSFDLCVALCVEPDEMWRYEGKVYRVHGNRRQYLRDGEWFPEGDEAGLMLVLENPEGIERSGKRLGDLRKRLEELKEEIREIEQDMKEWVK